MTDQIQARLILEILGRPASNVTDALKGMAEKIGKEKGVKIKDQQIHEPLPVKDAKDLFSSFAEITLECESLSAFFGIVFAYMPSHIELLEPSHFNLQSAELTLLTNRILGRLHNYDAVARRLVVDNNMLKQKLGIPIQSPQPAPAQPVKEKSKKSKPKKKKKK